MHVPGGAILERMNMRLAITALAVLLLLAACSAGMQVRGGHTLFHALPGSEFILHADIEIPPGRLRASFQGGKLLGGASEYEPRCELVLRNFSEQPQTIHAGTYIIDKVRGQNHYVLNADDRILLAASGGLQLAFDGGDSQWYMLAYHMKLRSEVYADAPTLICGGAYNFAYYVRYPSMEDMLVALGKYADIRLR